jgi:hypothetical protein
VPDTVSDLGTDTPDRKAPAAEHAAVDHTIDVVFLTVRNAPVLLTRINLDLQYTRVIKLIGSD